MANNHKRLDPEMVKQVMEAVAAAKEEVLSRSTFEALINTRPEDLIAPDPDSEVIKGNARAPGGWIHSPAILDLFASADKRLTRVSDWMGMSVKRVEKVKPNLVRGTKLLILKPAKEGDLTAIPVVRSGTSVTINLITLLGEHGLTVETGYRERFDIAYLPKESPLWPGLFLDLADVKERRRDSSPKKAAGAQPDGNNGVADGIEHESDDI